MKHVGVNFLIIILSSVIILTKSEDNNIAFVEIGSYVGADYAKKFFAPRFYKTTHSNARSICRAYHMDFAMIETSGEFLAVQESCKKNTNLFESWVLVDGITLSSKSQTDWYFTRTGDKIPYIMTWARNGGNSFLDDTNGVEKCLSLGPPNVYEFNDFYCAGIEVAFLCEKRASFKDCK